MRAKAGEAQPSVLQAFCIAAYCSRVTPDLSAACDRAIVRACMMCVHVFLCMRSSMIHDMLCVCVFMCVRACVRACVRNVTLLVTVLSAPTLESAVFAHMGST